MDFKTSLDRYLTTPPEDGFEDWCERVTDKMDSEIYLKHEDEIQSPCGVVNKWLNKLFDRGYEYYDTETGQESIEYCARVIERALSLYKTNSIEND